MKKISHMQYLSLLWIARILGVFYATLLGLFSLDSIQSDVAFWDNFGSLLLHLIPFIFIVLLLVLGWHRVILTGIGFIVISLAFLYFFPETKLINKLIAIGPGILNGLLFIVIHFIKPETIAPSPHEKATATERKK